jgi:hypothetical protein
MSIKSLTIRVTKPRHIQSEPANQNSVNNLEIKKPKRRDQPVSGWHGASGRTGETRVPRFAGYGQSLNSANVHDAGGTELHRHGLFTTASGESQRGDDGSGQNGDFDAFHGNSPRGVGTAYFF